MPPTGRLCTATTLRGTRCKNRAKAPGVICAVHLRTRKTLAELANSRSGSGETVTTKINNAVRERVAAQRALTRAKLGTDLERQEQMARWSEAADKEFVSVLSNAMATGVTADEIDRIRSQAGFDAARATRLRTSPSAAVRRRMEAAHGEAKKKATDRPRARAPKLDLRRFYGDQLTVTEQDTPIVQRHLADLARIPDAHHSVFKAFAKSNGGGIYIGDRPLPDLDQAGDLRGVRPRGHPAGSTWDKVGGAYRSKSTKALIASAPSGSESVAAHEFGHALDDALGNASNKKSFRAIVLDAQKAGMSPYYMQPGVAGQEETWAEAYAAWVIHQGEPDQAIWIGRALGLPYGPAEAIGARLAQHFKDLPVGSRHDVRAA